jgi:predicted anti-sigma-YlaC factor YlaD
MTEKDSRHLSQEVLELYLDGELDPAVLRAVKTHLDDCVECQREFRTMQSLFQAIESIPEEPFEHDLSQKVIASLRSQRSIPQPILWLALVEIAAVFGILVFSWPLTQYTARLSLILNTLEILSVTRLIPIITEFRSDLIGFLGQVPLGVEIPTTVSGLVLPVFAWTVIILSGVVVWFAMNGLLLSNIETRERRARRD